MYFEVTNGRQHSYALTKSSGHLEILCHMGPGGPKESSHCRSVGVSSTLQKALAGERPERCAVALPAGARVTRVGLD